MRGSFGVFAIEARVDPTLDGAFRTEANFELYADDGTGSQPPLEPGTFDLSAAPDDNYGTCQHCTLVVTSEPNGQARRVFFQSEGTLELTKLDPDDNTVAAGVLSGVKVVEVTQNPDLSWEVIPGGPCFTLPTWSFDTTVVNGLPCERAEDCPNTAQQICDPASRTCQPFQCNFTGDFPCEGEQFCVAQVPDENSFGACYQACSPASTGGCGAGEACVPIDPVQLYGVCRPRGEAAVGEPCDEPDVATGCAAGAVCGGYPAECQQVCAYLTAEPNCPAEHFCSQNNLCKRAGEGDAAEPGENCGEGAAFLQDCGPEAGGFRGLCLSLFPEISTLTCERTCRISDPACPRGQYCASIFSNPAVGLCWPVAVCGDGVLEILNEVCDDGNTESGDGCSADCKSAEFAPLCDDAEELTLDTTIASTTDGGPTGYVGTCETYQVLPTKTFRFLPPGPGRLSLKLEGATNFDLLVWSDCADPASELLCRSTYLLTERADLQFAEAPGEPLLIAVRGEGILDGGPFTLEAHYTLENCGDGVVAGGEACDDGNTAGGDGCSADCSAVAWPEICAGLPALSLTSPNAGTTAGGTTFNQSDGYCTSVFGSGAERMYRFTAPAAGTLHLTMDEGEANHALYVVDGCDAATELNVVACSNGGFPPGGYEELWAELAAGQAVTVVVDGFTPYEAGGYVLSAAFE